MDPGFDEAASLGYTTAMKDPAVDYFPLVAGRTLHYEVDRGGEVGRLAVEVLAVEQALGVTTARCRATETRSGDARVSEFEVVKDSSWVRVDGRQEFPLPPRPGVRWDAPPLACEVAGLDADVEVPAGAFAGCLKVSYLVAGGDAGCGDRYYAPGVGLVREDCSEESDPFELRLVCLDPPSP